MARKCSVSFESNYALLNDNQININEYLSGNHDDKKFLCIPNGHEMIRVIGCTKRRPHFRHKHNCDVGGSPMTQWHAEWQGNFPVTEKVFLRLNGQFKERRADILLPEHKHVIEIQHSKMEAEEVKQRMNDYTKHGHEVKWIIHGQDSIQFKIFGDERRILHFKNNLWLYDSFKASSAVYYDINGFIYRVNPNSVKNDMVDVYEPKLKSEFISSLKANINIWEDTEPPQCFLYVKQQGAGSGKTYGMMQFIDSDPVISNYKYIVFITKQHSAVSVMYKEFMEQVAEKKLSNIEVINPNESNDPKKYIVHYKNNLTNIEVKAIFATVDSFTHALASSPNNEVDKFRGIVKSIKDGTINTSRNGVMRYANVNPVLNKETLIMIDETQDLTELYGEAFLQIVKSKDTNLCVVGDRLQSLSYEKNALTFLHDAELAGLKVIKSSAKNEVRRFSNPVLIEFVNALIPFEKYDLPYMTPHKKIEANQDCLTVFQAKTVYSDADISDENVVEAVNEIMNLFEKEVKDNNRVPEDFLVVTPFTNTNPVIDALEIALNIFWKNIMEKNEEYINGVKKINKHWKNVNTDDYTRYAVFHKSQDGTSINMNDSKHATRMVSIHSSKGDGRPVVFVIGVTESALRLFSQVSNNLIYDSLLHVAITRQKETLYFRLEANGDDIHHKILNSGVPNIISASNSEFNYMSNMIKHSDISKDICDFIFDPFYEKLISVNMPPELPEQSENKLLIDMSDHNIRYASIAMNVWVHCLNHEYRTKSDTKKQFSAILYELTQSKIQSVEKLKDYIEILVKNTERTDGKKNQKCIPIIKIQERTENLDYGRYYKIINIIMNNILRKLTFVGKRELDYFCPIESVVLFYMIECIENGKKQNITIDNLYNTIHIYNNVFSNSRGHEHCGCNNIFIVKKNLSDSEKKSQEYLFNHYNRLAHIADILNNFNNIYPNVNWLYSHKVYLGNGENNSENADFVLYKEYRMIGYDAERVYVINIKPQFNDLNKNEFLIDSILDTYLVSNTSSENYKRFNKKPVISCVLSMNRNEIYKINWTDTVRNHVEFIKSSLYDILNKRYQNKHKQYHNIFKNIVEANTERTPAQCLDTCIKKTEKSKFPLKYMLRVWSGISTQIEDCDSRKGKKKIISKYMDLDIFSNFLNRMLNRSLKNFLDIKEEESDNDTDNDD